MATHTTREIVIIPLEYSDSHKTYPHSCKFIRIEHLESLYTAKDRNNEPEGERKRLIFDAYHFELQNHRGHHQEPRLILIAQRTRYQKMFSETCWAGKYSEKSCTIQFRLLLHDNSHAHKFTADVCSTRLYNICDKIRWAPNYIPREEGLARGWRGRCI